MRKVVMLNDGSEMPYTLFFGVPVHTVPSVVTESGLAVDGWIPVNKQTLETRFPGVYAVGDVAGIGTPKAGSFSEDAAKVVAAEIIAKIRSEEMSNLFTGKGSCYIEFGHGKVGRVDVDFFSGPTPTGVFRGQSAALSVEKYKLGSNRIKRWFGRTWGIKGE
jgi:sulfide:quinone oxidoreductase